MNAPVSSILARVGAVLPPDPINVGLRRSLTLPRVSFIIPTLNEADNLPWLLPRIIGVSHLRAIPDGLRLLKTILRERLGERHRQNAKAYGAG
ncbi:MULTISPECIES: hypothetical protein [unclassified Mesorhizobium]|uniref:hypothetical protein n=1 Tax=unclassified Mesorhizobium TaxID=325217 RepID=UPI00333DE078